MPWVNETRFLVQYELCKCKCGLTKSVCISKDKQNHDECHCESKKLNDRSSCKDHCMWNPSACDCECNKACKIDKCLDIKSYSCKKRLNGKLVFGCENEILNTTKTSLDNKKVICEKKFASFIRFLR